MDVGELERPIAKPQTLASAPALQARFTERVRNIEHTPAASTKRLARVALPDQLQPLQRKPVVHLVHLLAERHDRRGEPAGGDGGGLLAELLSDTPDDGVHLAR